MHSISMQMTSLNLKLLKGIKNTCIVKKLLFDLKTNSTFIQERKTVCSIKISAIVLILSHFSLICKIREFFLRGWSADA